MVHGIRKIEHAGRVTPGGLCFLGRKFSSILTMLYWGKWTWRIWGKILRHNKIAVWFEGVLNFKSFKCTDPFLYSSIFQDYILLRSLSAWKPGLPQRLSLGRSMFCMFSRSTAERSHSSQSLVCSRAGTKYCLLITWHTGEQDSSRVPWCMVLCPTNPLEVLLFMHGCHIFVVDGEIKMRAILCHHDAHETLYPIF